MQNQAQGGRLSTATGWGERKRTGNYWYGCIQIIAYAPPLSLANKFLLVDNLGTANKRTKTVLYYVITVYFMTFHIEDFSRTQFYWFHYIVCFQLYVESERERETPAKTSTVYRLQSHMIRFTEFLTIISHCCFISYMTYL